MPPTDLDIAERIVRLETKLDFIITQMERLPPSPVCVAKHKELDERLDDMDRWRNRAMGAILIINIVIVLFIDNFKQVFFGGP